MPKEIRLPQLGQTMEEGTIVSCMVKVGDEVKKGDIIFEVETDKATLEMESPADGFVKHILADLDQTLPVGEPLLVLGERDEEVSQSFLDSLKAAAPAAAAQVAPVAPTPVAEPQPQPTKTADRVIASPRAKKLAEELGVNLETVTGTGPAGRITEQDIKKAASSKPAVAEVKLGAEVPLSRIQKILAQRMLQSKRQIPCYYLTVKADVTDLVEFRAELNKTGDVEISYNDFIMRAVAVALKKFPIMTGQLIGDTIRLAEAIGIGLAISVPDGLVAPIIKDVDKKDVTQIARDSKALTERACSNKLTLADLEGGCITVTNLGAFGVESFTPIVVPGQCSILGIGRIADTCVPDNDNVVVRKLMNMTLSVDHKVANGTYASQFLDFVRKLLEDTSNFA